MAIRTNIRKDQDSLIVTLTGKLDFETANSFRDNLLKLEAQIETSNSTLIFDLGELQFVGSSGITTFIHALRDFNERATVKPRYTNVKSEFKRMIAAFDPSGSFEFWESNQRNIKSLDN